MRQSEEVSLLLIEDDEIDAMDFMRSIKAHRIANRIVRAHDGLEAWEIITGQSDKEISRPFLIVLDINMPRMNGIEFLRKLRADSKLKNAVVFVLTTSNDEKDRFEAYDLNVAGYMLKSDVGNSFEKAVGLVETYWKVVEFPVSRVASV
ncbi:MAG: response regulator [Pseudomonadota bacterium]